MTLMSMIVQHHSEPKEGVGFQRMIEKRVKGQTVNCHTDTDK